MIHAFEIHCIKKTHRSDWNGQNKKDLQEKHLNIYRQELRYIHACAHIMDCAVSFTLHLIDLG